jgi:hypothetical protein
MNYPVRSSAFAIWAALSLSGSVPAQDADTLTPWLNKVRPEIERLLGYRAPLMRVEIGKREVTRSVEVETHLRLKFPHLDKTSYPPALADALAVNDQADLARVSKGTLRVYPENAARMPRWHRVLEAAAPSDLIKLAMLHDVVRSALETRYDLARRRQSCRDAEEWFALEAVIEGRAQWLTRALAGRLGMQETFPLLAQRLLYVPDVSPDSALRLMSQSVQRQKHWAQTQGLVFWTYLEGVKDLDEAKVFARPPLQTKWINQPALYVQAARGRRPDLATVLGSLQETLPSGDWAVQPQAWTSEMLVQVAGLLGERPRAEKLLQNWVDGRSLVWSRRNDPARMVSLSVARFDAAGSARAYFGFAVDLQRKRDELSNTPGGLPLRVVESRSTKPALDGAEEAILLEKRVELPNSRQAIPVHTLLVRQGEHVVEMSWHGMSADLRWAQGILRAVGAASHASEK